MDNLSNIFQIGFYDGLTWFPIVLAIGILYKYLKSIDVSIDGITVISSIAFTATYNFSGSLISSLIITMCAAMISYALVSFLTNELKINNILAGIILSLILHSVSVIYVGESLPLKYESLTFLNSHSVALSITFALALLTEFFFRTNFGVRLKVAADNPNVNISVNPRILTFLVYIISGLILSIGVVQYTCKIGLSRSGGGFEFLITALSSFLFIDRIIDSLINIANRKKANYSYNKYIAYSLVQSPVFKALVGSILFQIIVLLIIYYTSNPAYWKFIFGIILLVTVAKPQLNIFFKKKISSGLKQKGITLENLSFQYDNGYEKREVFRELNFQFKPGLNIIWGSNGVGKTSLLKLLSGKLKPDSGSILKNGTEITNLNMQKRKVFYITQMPYDSLSTNTTVFENIAATMPLFSKMEFSIAKPLSVESKRQLDFDIKFGKQNPFWVQNTSSLSGGQAQKLNLFLCNSSNADLILADEPTSGMDDNNFKLFEIVIKDIQSTEKTIVLVTHDERLKGFSAYHYKLLINSLTKL